MLLAISAGEKFDGFSGASFLLLVAAFVALAVFVVVFAAMWLRSYPRLPDAGPETDELGPEPPAVVNLMANRWKVTRSAIPATLVDLAARRVVGIDLVGTDEYVVRVRDGKQTKEKLSPYEQRVLDLVIERTRGVSCPVKALDLGEAGQAESWVKRFDKAVVQQAKDLGLAQPRWRGAQLRTVSLLLALPLFLFASAFALSHLAEGTGSASDQWDQSDWYGVALIVWVAGTVWLGAQRDLRDTTAGRKACAAWLGVRRHYRESHAFDNAPAASVVVWERHLAYGVALGAAHEAAADLPFVADDPGEAWSRSTGMWRQIRVNYPVRFGYGESPGTVFFGGLWRTLLFGGIAFVVLPIAASIAWDAGTTALDQQNQQRLGTAFLVSIVAIGTILGLYLTIRTLAGLIRLYRAVADFGKPIAVEGEVVKNHFGRVAIDNGKADEFDAFAATALTQSLQRGAKARVTYTKHLRHVKKVEVVQAAAPSSLEAATQASPAISIPISPLVLGDVQAVVSRAVGVEMAPAQADAQGAGLPAGLPVALQAFSDGHGGTVAVVGLRVASGPIEMMLNFLAKRGHAVDAVSGASATWSRDMDLLVRRDDTMTVVHVDLPGRSGEQRLEVAREIALALGSGTGEAAPGTGEETAAPA